MSVKGKLVVVVGAGASVEFGFPTVEGVGRLLRRACVESFPLADDPTRGVYEYICDAIEGHRTARLHQSLVRCPNFEEVMYAILELRALYPKGVYTAAIGALASARPDLPIVGLRGRPPRRLDAEVLDELGPFIADMIVDSFRARARTLDADRTAELELMRGLFELLATKFEITVVSLNYDDIAWRTAGVVENGFRPDGSFDDGRLIARADWPCFLHLHGSVHFDMRPHGVDLHRICWESDLGGTFSQNSFGRSGVYATEGNLFPQSVLVAGFGKTQQMLRRPFRTYYSELDRVIVQSDALLCLGYGFGDAHLNAALSGYHDGSRRKVVLVDYAQKDWMTAGGAAKFQEKRPIVDALGVFNCWDMAASGSTAPDTVAGLLDGREFELSTDPERPLAIWFNGMLEACRHAPKVLSRLL